MRKLSCILFLIAVLVVAKAEPLADVPSSSKRVSTVTFAKMIVSSQSASVAGTSDGDALKNPFHPLVPDVPATGAGMVAAPPAQVENARLEEIAPKITPSGSVEIGGEALLLFGQKRLKVGDHLSIVFQGQPYELEIVGIQSTSFTLRLNGIEITRPIKSITKP